MTAPRPQDRTIASLDAGRWTAIAEETAGYLQRMIRFDTTNPPGNELPLAAWIQTVLGDNGIESRLVQPAPDRAVVCARLAGSGSGRPILLTAHMDVVPVERDQWQSEPFGGERRDGYIYGRGAIDDKGMLAANLVTLLLVKREIVDAGGALDRDVVFLATSDEETGGEWGMPWVIEHHPEFVDAEYALNEGGRIRIVGDRPLYAAIQTSEKVSNVVTVRAKGPSGHASVPVEGNAIARLARAIAIVASARQPRALVPTTRAFFRELSRVWPDEALRRSMADIGSADPDEADAADAALARVPMLDATLRDTISPTVIAGGIRANVIPAEADATLSLRTLPGHSPDNVVDRLVGLIDDPAIEMEIVSRGCMAAPSDHESVMFAALRAAIRDVDPSVVTVPYLSTGATESAYLRAHGIQCYGLLPFPLTPADEARMHGHDERVSIDALRFGVQVVYGTVRGMAFPGA